MYLYRCRRTVTTVSVELISLNIVCDLYMYLYRCRRTVTTVSVELTSLSVVCGGATALITATTVVIRDIMFKDD